MIFISPADFSINFLKPIDLENKLYYVKLYAYNKHISTLLDKVISMGRRQKAETYQDKSGMSLPDAMNVATK